MTDVQVSQLTRRDLLKILLDVEMENEALMKDQSALRQQVIDLEGELQKQDSGMADAGIQAAALLQEARTAADNAAASQREALAAQEQRLKEWEQHLQERETWLKQQEEKSARILEDADNEAVARMQEANRYAQEVIDDAKRQADQTLAEAGKAASELIRRAEKAASGTEEQAANNAEKILQRAQQDSNAFWQDMNELLKRRLQSEGGSNG